MNLNERFDVIKGDIESKENVFSKNTEMALVFIINHFDTLISYKNYRSRTQFRSHIVNILDNEYGASNYSKNDVLKLMSKKGYYSSAVYFFTSLISVGLVVAIIHYFIPSDYLIIFDLLFLIVGTLAMTVILDMWGMK